MLIVTLSENEMTVGRKMPINPTYTSEGKKYEFLGWNTKSDGSGTNFTDSTHWCQKALQFMQSGK